MTLTLTFALLGSKEHAEFVAASLKETVGLCRFASVCEKRMNRAKKVLTSQLPIGFTKTKYFRYKTTNLSKLLSVCSGVARRTTANSDVVSSDLR